MVYGVFPVLALSFGLTRFHKAIVPAAHAAWLVPVLTAASLVFGGVLSLAALRTAGVLRSGSRTDALGPHQAPPAFETEGREQIVLEGEFPNK